MSGCMYVYVSGFHFHFFSSLNSVRIIQIVLDAGMRHVLIIVLTYFVGSSTRKQMCFTVVHGRWNNKCFHKRHTMRSTAYRNVYATLTFFRWNSSSIVLIAYKMLRCFDSLAQLRVHVSEKTKNATLTVIFFVVFVQKLRSHSREFDECLCIMCPVFCALSRTASHNTPTRQKRNWLLQSCKQRARETRLIYISARV